MSLFDPRYSIESLNKMNKGTLAEQLGIEFVEVGPNFITAKMPVDHRTRQPLGLLHGGASVALAETLGSVAAYGTLDMSKQHCVGLEINANHIKSAKDGMVIGTATPVHMGKRTQIWQIDIKNEAQELVCVSRITMMILDR